MPERRICTFSGEEIEPGTGMMFVRRDGSVMWFKNSKARKNMVAAQAKLSPSQVDPSLRQGRHLKRLCLPLSNHSVNTETIQSPTYAVWLIKGGTVGRFGEHHGNNLCYDQA